MRQRLALGIAVLVGIVWAIVQLVYNSAAVSLSDQELVDCGVDPSSTETFKLLTIGVALAAALAFVVSFRRRPAAVLSLLAVEGVLVALWFAIGAGDAASCAIE